MVDTKSRVTLRFFHLCPTAPVVRFECTNGDLGVATLLPASWETEWRRVATDCPDAIALELAEAADRGEADPRFRGYDVSRDAAFDASDATYEAMQADALADAESSYGELTEARYCGLEVA